MSCTPPHTRWGVPRPDRKGAAVPLRTRVGPDGEGGGSPMQGRGRYLQAPGRVPASARFLRHTAGDGWQAGHAAWPAPARRETRARRPQDAARADGGGGNTSRRALAHCRPAPGRAHAAAQAALNPVPSREASMGPPGAAACFWKKRRGSQRLGYSGQGAPARARPRGSAAHRPIPAPRPAGLRHCSSTPSRPPSLPCLACDALAGPGASPRGSPAGASHSAARLHRGVRCSPAAMVIMRASALDAPGGLRLGIGSSTAPIE